MNPDRWRQIEELYQAAQDCKPDECATLLASADPEIRNLVVRMLELPSDGRLLDRPIDAWPTVPVLTALAPGVQLGPYKIEALLGTGGMGDRISRPRHAAGKECRAQASPFR